jgi:hypothetical protein
LQRHRLDLGILFGFLSLAVAVVALLFGDQLLRTEGARNDPESALDATPGGNPNKTGQQGALKAVDAPKVETAEAARIRILAALDAIPKDEWCLAPSALLLKRVLKSVSRPELERVADAGDARAGLLAGRGYVDGLFGFPKDSGAAFSHFKRAAASGDPAAMNLLSAAYDMGLGTEKDPYAAVRLQRQASDAGCINATYNLGLSYSQGSGGLPVDQNEALRLFRIAAQEGHELARHKLVAHEFETSGNAQ